MPIKSILMGLLTTSPKVNIAVEVGASYLFLPHDEDPYKSPIEVEVLSTAGEYVQYRIKPTGFKSSMNVRDFNRMYQKCLS